MFIEFVLLKFLVFAPVLIEFNLSTFLELYLKWFLDAVMIPILD